MPGLIYNKSLLIEIIYGDYQFENHNFDKEVIKLLYNDYPSYITLVTIGSGKQERRVIFMGYSFKMGEQKDSDLNYFELMKVFTHKRIRIKYKHKSNIFTLEISIGIPKELQSDWNYLNYLVKEWENYIEEKLAMIES